MADEQLRLVASLKDNASAVVRRIKSELKGIDVGPGMRQAQKWVRGFNEDLARFKRSSMTVANVMSAMGIGGLAAAGSIGTLAAAFKSLADRTLDMKELGREVGLTADEINAMNRAGQHFGFDPSEMEGAIKHFAGLMPEFKRGYGELNNILARQPDLIKRLRVEDTKTQIQEIFRFLDTIRNPQDRMVFERGIFGTDGIEKLFKDGGGGFEAQAEKFRQTLAPITEAAAAQAQALRDAINDFNVAVDNLELKAGPTVYKWLTAGVTELGTVLDKVEKAPGDIAAAAATIAGSLAALKVRNSIVRGSSLAGGSSIRAAGVSLDKTAVTLNEAAIALREAAAELRGRGAPPGAGPQASSKTGGTSFDNGRALLAAAGLVGVVTNAPGMDEAGDREREANASALEAFGQKLKDWTGQSWLEGKLGDWRNGRPSAAQFHPDDDRLSRARSSDVSDHWSDGVVLGSLGKEVIHLTGTLKTAAAQAEADGIKPAAFHPSGVLASGAALDPVATIAAGTKAGVLAALRELQGASLDDAASGRSGIIPASFGGGGGAAGNPMLGGGDFVGQPNLSGGDAQGAEADRIREIAKKYGIDPRVAVAVAKSEGLGVAWGAGMDHGASFGAFQLHVGGGLGDIYQRETGRDPRNAANADDMDDWALQYASKHGWGDWHGAARIGVRGMAGIGGRPVGNIAPGMLGSGDAVDRALSMRNMTGEQAAAALHHTMHTLAWCADFTNGIIEHGGGKGSGSALARSFMGWGRGVPLSDVRRNDVAVLNGGRHVGLFTGERDKDGRLGVVAGNTRDGQGGHRVMHYFVRPESVFGARRGVDDLRAASEKLREAAAAQQQAVHRSDLGAERRKLALRDQAASRIEGGIDAHVHLHDNRTHTRVERRGVVREAGITVRSAPQRTFTV